MKLGRFKFRVRQMVTSGSGGQQPELKLDDSGAVCRMDPECKLDAMMCRICLLEGPTEDDPLITPCQCKGSIEYVHLGCLRHWIKGRLNCSDTTSGSYFYRPLACELCKVGYPAYVHVGTQRLPIVETPRTTPPFIVLENIVRNSQQHASRGQPGLHVISLAENKLLKLGRGHESDVRISDVSISRCHATIRFNKGQFVLEDHNSKFGTLVAMKKPRSLDLGSAISIQVGRTVLAMSLQPHPDVGAETGAMLQSLPAGGHTADDERGRRLSLLTRSSTDGEDEPSILNAAGTQAGGPLDPRGSTSSIATGDGDPHLPGAV